MFSLCAVFCAKYHLWLPWRVISPSVWRRPCGVSYAILIDLKKKFGSWQAMEAGGHRRGIPKGWDKYVWAHLADWVLLVTNGWPFQGPFQFCVSVVWSSHGFLLWQIVFSKDSCSDIDLISRTLLTIWCWCSFIEGGGVYILASGKTFWNRYRNVKMAGNQDGHTSASARLDFKRNWFFSSYSWSSPHPWLVFL